MNYIILRTEKADNQLSRTINYIAAEATADIALNYLNKIEKAIMNLQKFPYSGTTPRYAILKKQHYLVLIVEKHLIFYKVLEELKHVMIYAIVDSRQEYKNLI